MAFKDNLLQKIRIDQLEWGEATATKGEATLPVKFATSLLKDADGVISLAILDNQKSHEAIAEAKFAAQGRTTVEEAMRVSSQFED